MGSSTVYVADAAGFDSHKERLKLLPCPHCRAVGCLIRHGYLKGYGDHAKEKRRRGWRIFCSDRGRRTGCGRTYAVLLAICLYRRRVDADLLWNFLRMILEGARRATAWETATASFCVETGSRLWAGFLKNQSRLRSFLHRRMKPSALLSPEIPVGQLLAHLQAAFPDSSSPVAAFQHTLQEAFLIP